MSISPEEQLRLSACIEEIAQILYKNTASLRNSHLRRTGESSTSTDARICQPQSCPFFIQKVTKTATGQGRTRTLNSCLGRLKITQKQANRLGIEPYSRKSPLLEKCCFLLSASESYQNASIDLGTLTGVKVSHSSQHRLVQRQEFSAPEASQALAQLSIALVCHSRKRKIGE